jgi:carbonic anhydrase
VQDAWQRGQEVVVHGWVYGLHNGLLEDLSMTVAGSDDVRPAYERALALVRERYAPGQGRVMRHHGFPRAR